MQVPVAQPGVRGTESGVRGEAEGAGSRNTGGCSGKGWCSTADTCLPAGEDSWRTFSKPTGVFFAFRGANHTVFDLLSHLCGRCDNNTDA